MSKRNRSETDMTVNNEETGEVDAIDTPRIMPNDFFGMVGDGFASVETVLLGDPKDGKLPFYLGRLVGKGEITLMETSDGKNSEVQNWVFHPIVKDDSGYGIDTRITHVIPGTYQITAVCAQVLRESERLKTTALVGFQFMEQGKTRKGFRVNRYRPFVRYEGVEVPPTGIERIASSNRQLTAPKDE